MVKQLLYKTYKIDGQLKADIEAVITFEVAKAKEQPQPELNPIAEPYETFGTLGYKKPQPALNPIAEAYEMGEKIRQKNWLKNAWIQKLSKTESTSDTLTTFSNNWDFITHPKKWELYTEPAEQVAEPTEQPAKPFDKDRFERIFCAIVASGKTETWEQDFKGTIKTIEKLDAYYASKEGGENE